LQHGEEVACSRPVSALYLLTTTAADFFARHGYHVTNRADAPEFLQATTEFSRLCPESAVCMVKFLSDSGHPK
jgi:amino-acid N-acetyltransferase